MAWFISPSIFLPRFTLTKLTLTLTWIYIYIYPGGYLKILKDILEIPYTISICVRLSFGAQLLRYKTYILSIVDEVINLHASNMWSQFRIFERSCIMKSRTGRNHCVNSVISRLHLLDPTWLCFYILLRSLGLFCFKHFCIVTGGIRSCASSLKCNILICPRDLVLIVMVGVNN